MGNCCTKCIRLVYKRRVLRQYTALDANLGGVDEGADLFDEDDGDGLLNASTSSRRSPSALTEHEKLLLKSKNYAAIISSQKTFDDQIDKQLAEQEEKLKREEEELLKLRKSRTENKPKNESALKISNTPSDVLWSAGEGDSEWNVAGGEDDFDMFLDSVATRDKSAGAVEEEINEEDFVSGFTPS